MRLMVMEFKSFKDNHKYKKQICPICEKDFINGWKFKKKKYCSFKCMRVDEEKYLKKINAKLLDIDNLLDLY